MIRRWQTDIGLNKYPKKTRELKRASRQKGAGRKPLLSAARENELYEWVLDLRLNEHVVMRKMLKRAATNFARHDGHANFVAFDRWVHNFMLRHKLSLRASSTLCKLTDEQLVQRVVAFRKSMDAQNNAFQTFRDEDGRRCNG
jgi:hypothetical protein